VKNKFVPLNSKSPVSGVTSKVPGSIFIEPFPTFPSLALICKLAVGGFIPIPTLPNLPLFLMIDFL